MVFLVVFLRRGSLFVGGGGIFRGSFLWHFLVLFGFVVVVVVVFVHLVVFGNSFFV